MKEMTLEFGQELAQEGDFQEDVAKEISVVKGNRISWITIIPPAARMMCSGRFIMGYQKALRKRKLDFDDMLLCCYQLFVKRKDILAAWQNKFNTLWWMNFRISTISSMIL